MKIDGAKLKRAREVHLIPLKDVAKFCGVNDATIAKIESGGTKSPRVELLRKLAEFFKVSPEEFVETFMKPEKAEKAVG